jgi:hypothetical protein
LAINNISLDTESDYDTDDIEATLNSSKLTLSDSMIGDGAGNLVNPKRPQINDLELDGSWEDDDDDASLSSGRKIRRKKRRSRKEIDLDKTPTADQCHADFSLLRAEGPESPASPATSSSSKTSDSNCAPSDDAASPAIVIN